MASLRFILLAGASLVSLNLQRALGSNAISDGKGNKATTISCAPQMNKAREAAGLAPFEEEVFELSNPGDNDLENICTMLTADISEKGLDIQDAIPMIAPQSGPFANCDEAVEYWKSAGKEIGDTIPPYEKEKPPYNSMKNLGFFGLYNPREKAEVKCMFITCKSEKADSKQSGKEASGGQLGAIMKSKSTTSSSLSCITTPVALQKGLAPFTGEQWTGIRNSGATMASPASLAFAAFAAVSAAIVLI